MSDDLKLVKEKFCGTWVHARDDNMENCLKDLGYPQQFIDFLMGCKPRMTISVDGDNITLVYELMPGKAQSHVFKLGEWFVGKDDNDPPMYHNKELCTVENGKMKYISKSQLEGPLAIDTLTYYERVGDELHTPMNKLDDTSGNPVIGNRVMVRES